jgi:hypothetical protein
MLVRPGVELAPCQPRIGDRDTTLSIDCNALHLRNVDDESAFDERYSGDVMSSCANCRIDVMFDCELNGCLDVSGFGATKDHRRPAIDHAVPDTPRFVIAGGFGRKNIAAKSRSESL